MVFLKILNELNLVTLGRLDPYIATAVGHHEPENQALYCLSVDT